MKTLLSLTLTFLVTLCAFAKAELSTTASSDQDTCDCRKDLAFIDTQVREMISFKKQIKGEKLEQYESTLNELLSAETEKITVADCYLKLNELISIVQDIHARILYIKNPVTKEMVENDKATADYIQSKAFLNHPKYQKNLEELASVLQTKDYNDIEGIYNYAEKLTVGIVKKGGIYEGVVLESSSAYWVPGHVKYTLRKVAPDMYDVVTSDHAGGKMRILRAALHYDGRIWMLKKERGMEFTHMQNDQNPWVFEQINDHTQYVYFGTFGNADDNVAAFQKFYDRYRDSFTAKNIIVDLRDNSGGNSKYSDPFYKIIKRNKMNVYVITNFYTASNGEQFTLKLKRLKNTKHLGQRTYGAIAYGSNYGTLLETPSGEFAIYPTDMNFHKYIDYEYVGVKPEITLDFDKDWVEQTLDIIESKE